MLIMRCCFVCLLLSFSVSAQSSLKISGDKQLKYHNDDISLAGRGEILLQRRGNQKKGKGEGGKSGKDSKPSAPSQRLGGKTLPIAVPQRHKSPSGQGKTVKETPLASIPDAWIPASPPQQGSIGSSRSPKQKNQQMPPLPPWATSLASDSKPSSFPGSHIIPLPLAMPQPRAPYIDPPQPAQASPSRSVAGRRAKRVKTSERDLSPSLESQMTRLRVTQEQGATQSSSQIGPNSMPPPPPPPPPLPSSPALPSLPTSLPFPVTFVIKPRRSQQVSPVPGNQPQSPSNKASSSQAGLPPKVESPYKTLKIEQGVPAAKGIHWLPEQQRITQEWKEEGAQEDALRSAADRLVQKAANDKSLAKASRRLNNEHLAEARTAMSNGPALDPDVRKAVQRSKSSLTKAQAFQFALSRSEGFAAEALITQARHTEAAEHLQKSNRALARHEVYLQHGQALDYKYINKGVSEGLTKLRKEGVSPSPLAMQNAVAMRRTYKAAAEGYHQTWRDYQTVRNELDGSSSDESEKSTFDDVLTDRKKKTKEAKGDGGN